MNRFAWRTGVLVALGCSVVGMIATAAPPITEAARDRVDRRPIRVAVPPVELMVDRCELEWQITGPAGETTVTETGMPGDPFGVEIKAGVSSFGTQEQDLQVEAIYGAGIVLRPLVDYTIEITYDLSTWDSYSSFDGFWDVFFVNINSTGFYWNLVDGTPVADLICSSSLVESAQAPLSGPLWTFGGNDYGDGLLCMEAGTVTLQYMETDPSKIVHLSVGLDTGLTGKVDGQYPSWGTWTVSITGQDCPDDADLARWNAPAVRPRNNCYNYATNRQTDMFAQPGDAGGMPFAAMTCEAVKAAAIADGLCPVADPDDCTGDACVVALVVAPGPPISPVADYHWYRRNDDGTWSHKPGGTAAILTDSSGQPIMDPRMADRRFRLRNGTFLPGYTQFCGFFCVPGDVTLMPPPFAPPSSPEGVTGVAVTVLQTAGLPGPSWVMDDAGRIAAIIAAIEAGDPVTPPSELEGLGYRGFMLESLGVPGFPSFVRILGTVAEVFDGIELFYRTIPADIEAQLRDDASENGAGGVFDFCQGDLDLDGQRGLTDVLLVLSSWGPVNDLNLIGDLDADGTVGFGDILLLLGVWGPCP
jgi:hypothetical protein